MGVYWASFVYHGRLLRRETYDAFMALEPSVRQGCAVTPVGDLYALHAPGRGFWAGSVDPLLEPHEIHRGWVDADEVDGVIDRREGKRPAWDAATPEQIAHVDAVVESLAESLGGDRGIAVYICEAKWWSSEPASSSVTNNIVVVKRPGQTEDSS